MAFMAALELTAKVPAVFQVTVLSDHALLQRPKTVSLLITPACYARRGRRGAGLFLSQHFSIGGLCAPRAAGAGAVPGLLITLRARF
jgi:hypothetical protein